MRTGRNAEALTRTALHRCADVGRGRSARTKGTCGGRGPRCRACASRCGNKRVARAFIQRGHSKTRVCSMRKQRYGLQCTCKEVAQMKVEGALHVYRGPDAAIEAHHSAPLDPPAQRAVHAAGCGFQVSGPVERGPHHSELRAVSSVSCRLRRTVNRARELAAPLSTPSAVAAEGGSAMTCKHAGECQTRLVTCRQQQ